MAVTTNLGITKIDTAQAQKEVTANLGTDTLDAALAGVATVSIAGTGTVTLTAVQAMNAVLILTGVLTGNRTVEFPNGSRHWIVFNNTTGAFTVTLKRTAQTGFVIGQAKHAICYYNGTDIVRATADL